MSGSLGANERARGTARAVPEAVAAVVVTHMRPGLAGDVTRSLLEAEAVPPERVVVVVNGTGGLDDPELESAVRMVRIGENLGPAGGFRVGMEVAFADPSVRWAYLCEDDVTLFSLPTPRITRLLARTDQLEPSSRNGRVGAVVAYGRRFVGRGAHTVNYVPPGQVTDLVPVDVACWGATLVSREVFDAGILPDGEWFFGLEDFDFFSRVRRAGFDVVVDPEAARLVADQQSSAAREGLFGGRRPTDPAEAWRAYYHARNSWTFIRRYGRPGWIAWHLAYSARRLQLARSWAERSAIAHGLWDGARGRMGRNPRYERTVGEWTTEAAGPGARSAR